MSNYRLLIMVPLLVGAIGLSIIVPQPMATIQAAVCGFSLGVKFMMLMVSR